MRIRVADAHHQSTTVDGKLRQLTETFAETGRVRPDVTGDTCREEDPTERGVDVPF